MRNILFVVFILCLLAGCAKTGPALNFWTEECNDDINPYSQPSAGILNKTWEQENIFVADGYVKTFCGGAEILPDYLIEGDNLTLKYKLVIGDTVTSCMCAHKVIYEFSNLEHKEYVVSIIRQY